MTSTPLSPAIRWEPDLFQRTKTSEYGVVGLPVEKKRSVEDDHILSARFAWIGNLNRHGRAKTYDLDVQFPIVARLFLNNGIDRDRRAIT